MKISKDFIKNNYNLLQVQNTTEDQIIENLKYNKYLTLKELRAKFYKDDIRIIDIEISSIETIDYLISVNYNLRYTLLKSDSKKILTKNDYFYIHIEEYKQRVRKSRLKQISKLYGK